MSQFTIESARRLLFEAGVFYYNDVESERKGMIASGLWTEEVWERDWREEIEKGQQELNMNDVWGWAWADCYQVPDDQLIECATLFHEYGWCGILYFVSKHTDNCRSEFYDNNRKIEFVANEERIKQEKPGSSERAYFKTEYAIRGDRRGQLA